MGVFRKAGFDAIAYPVAYRTPWQWDFDPARNLRIFEIAMREWIGLLARSLKDAEKPPHKQTPARKAGKRGAGPGVVSATIGHMLGVADAAATPSAAPAGDALISTAHRRLGASPHMEWPRPRADMDGADATKGPPMTPPVTEITATGKLTINISHEWSPAIVVNFCNFGFRTSVRQRGDSLTLGPETAKLCKMAI
jgi:hypothetical protein